MYITACIHTCATYQVHSYYELFMSVYIVCEQSRGHQPVVHMLACSEYYFVRVRSVCAISHAGVLEV